MSLPLTPSPPQNVSLRTPTFENGNGVNSPGTRRDRERVDTWGHRPEEGETRTDGLGDSDHHFTWTHRGQPPDHLDPLVPDRPEDRPQQPFEVSLAKASWRPEDR